VDCPEELYLMSPRDEQVVQISILIDAVLNTSQEIV